MPIAEQGGRIEEEEEGEEEEEEEDKKAAKEDKEAAEDSEMQKSKEPLDEVCTDGKMHFIIVVPLV